MFLVTFEIRRVENFTQNLLQIFAIRPHLMSASSQRREKQDIATSTASMSMDQRYMK